MFDRYEVDLRNITLDSGFRRSDGFPKVQLRNSYQCSRDFKTFRMFLNPAHPLILVILIQTTTPQQRPLLPLLPGGLLEQLLAPLQPEGDLVGLALRPRRG